MSSPALDDDLFDTVAADFLARYRSGERPTTEVYAARHPAIAAEIRELFPTMLAIEQMKQQKEQSSGGRASLGARKLERLGDFRIIREIGRGGMGIVFEAEQESLERHVALKVLPPNALQDDSHIRRFHREAQTAARLHHTNIVPVFGVGEDDGLHYYVMQLIDGEPLDRRLQSGKPDPLDPRRAADIVRQIADAVQFAHDQGTLHRDIKPANLLLDHSGNVWITDFGLAQVLERDETITDHVAGTLRYMAPERFRGVADERTDQYSLGITLYELLAGVRAFEGSSSGELLHRITHSEPTPLRLLAPGVPRDLETIVQKAISREPAHRYARMHALAADLQSFLDGRPIAARPISTLGRSWRWCRRNPALASALSAIVVLVLVVASMIGIGYFRTQRLNRELSDSLAKIQSARAAEQAALDGERQARAKEHSARKAAEAITSLALDGLDRVFEEFAPSAPYTVALPVTESAEEEANTQPLLLPAQATVNPQVAAALERLLPLYRQLADETGQDSQVRWRAASAQHRLGLIYQQLGRQDAARTALSAARALLEALEQEPATATPELRLSLAQVLNDVGDLDRFAFQFYRERRAAYQQAMELLSSVAPSDLPREALLELARTHLNLGRPDGMFPGPPRTPGRDGGADGVPPPGDPGVRRPGDRGPRDRGPGDGDSPPPPPPPPPDGERPPPDGRLGDAGSRGPKGNLRGDGSRNGGPDRRGPGRGSFGSFAASRAESRQHLATAISLLEGLPDGDRDTRAQLLLARCYREQSNQRDWEDADARRGDWERAVAILKDLVQEAPGTAAFRFELSEAFADIEPRWMPDERLPEAEPRLREALDLSLALVAESPDVPAYAMGQTQIRVKLGDIMRRTDRIAEARDQFTAAIAVQNELAQRLPETPSHQIWTARIRRYLAELLLGEGQPEKAAELLRQSIGDVEPALKSQSRSDPTAMFAAFTLGETCEMLAGILRDLGRTEEAEAYQQKARELGPQSFFRDRRPPLDAPSPELR